MERSTQRMHLYGSLSVHASASTAHRPDSGYVPDRYRCERAAQYGFFKKSREYHIYARNYFSLELFPAKRVTVRCNLPAGLFKRFSTA